MKTSSVEVGERYALYQFNSLIIGFNKSLDGVLRVRLKALQELLRGEKKIVRALYLFFTRKFAHWGVSAKYNERDLREMIERLSDQKFVIKSEELPAHLIDRVEQNILKRKGLEAAQREFCTFHSDKKVVHAEPEFADDVSSRVCKECMYQLDAAFVSEELSMYAPLEQMIQYLRHRLVKDQMPVFRAFRTSVSPEKIGAREVKRGYCEVHPDRKVVTVLRGLPAEHRLQICRGCVICLGKAAKKGIINKSSTPAEMKQYLIEKIGDR